MLPFWLKPFLENTWFLPLPSVALLPRAPSCARCSYRPLLVTAEDSLACSGVFSVPSLQGGVGLSGISLRQESLDWERLAGTDDWVRRGTYSGPMSHLLSFIVFLPFSLLSHPLPASPSLVPLVVSHLPARFVRKLERLHLRLTMIPGAYRSVLDDEMSGFIDIFGDYPLKLKRRREDLLAPAHG